MHMRPLGFRGKNVLVVLKNAWRSCASCGPMTTSPMKENTGNFRMSLSIQNQYNNHYQYGWVAMQTVLYVVPPASWMAGLLLRGCPYVSVKSGLSFTVKPCKNTDGL